MPEKILQNARILHDFCQKKKFFSRIFLRGGQLPPVSYAYDRDSNDHMTADVTCKAGLDVADEERL